MRLLLLAAIPLFGSITDDEYQKRINSHLIVGDAWGAVIESDLALKEYPDSSMLQAARIHALARSGRALDALFLWRDKKDEALLETVCWGFIEKGEGSMQLLVSLFSMLSSASTHDVRAVPLILSGLRSSNAFLRSVAVNLVVQFRDQVLISELFSMLESEKVWYVRLGILEAAGSLGMNELVPELENIVENEKSSIEERSVAAHSLVQLIENANVDTLFISKRAGLRYLGTEIALHLDMFEKSESIATLLSDPSPAVRMASLRTLGLLKTANRHQALVEKLMYDSHPQVAIGACWVMMQLDHKKGEKEMEKWLFSRDADQRRVAAAAITRCGEIGQRLAIKALQESNDRFVRATIAYGLIGQHVEKKLCCDVLYDFLEKEGGRIMLSSNVNPYFEFLAPSEVFHSAQMSGYPSYVDQHTRLRLLSILAQHRYPRSIDIVKTFLRRRIDGLTYVASMLLMQEGESDALPLIRELLDDEDGLVRVQAALVLALVGGDKEAISTLTSAYDQVDRDMKVNILSAIGYLGEKNSIPFLSAQLEEPFALLRLVAASSLIQCLYH